MKKNILIGIAVFFGNITCSDPYKKMLNSGNDTELLKEVDRAITAIKSAPTIPLKEKVAYMKNLNSLDNELAQRIADLKFLAFEYTKKILSDTLTKKFTQRFELAEAMKNPATPPEQLQAILEQQAKQKADDENEYVFVPASKNPKTVYGPISA
jgi:hypothetical protein